jgi:thimet oligopeptidase
MKQTAAALAAATLVVAACGGRTTPTEPSVPEQPTPPAAGSTPPAGDPVAQFTAECRAGLDAARAMLPAITGVTGARTIENTLEPYNELYRRLDTSAGMAGLLREVHPDEKLREAAAECEQEVRSFDTQLKLDRGLYQAFAALDTTAFDPATRRLVEHTLRDFRRAGTDKDDATRARLEQLDKEMTEIGQEFDRNIADDVRHVAVGPDRLGGLPADYVAAHPAGADGKIKISTDNPDYVPVLTYADDDALRRELYVARKARGAGKNDALLRELLVRRHEKARLLGYANYADYITEDKMIKSGKAAAEFIERVTRASDKRARRDYADLLKRKRRDDKKAERVEDWQKLYYDNKIKAEDYGLDAQEVREYFDYEAVEAGLLAITAEIYGIEYRPVTDPRTWHEDVKVFDVLRDGKEMGRIFLDMHPREGKYKHMAQFSLKSGVAGKQLPEGALVCNFPDPRTAKPALMEHGDVETMFHEFGHLMHHLFAGHQRWIMQSGVATEHDFVEAPSQAFEEWAWSYETLKRFARHHRTGQPITEDLVNRMRRVRDYGLGLVARQQMFYAAVSLQFHVADPHKLDMDREVRRLQAKYTPFGFVEGTAMHANFGHLNGYSAMYYTYMWSLVVAKDMLTPFLQHGLLDTTWTHKYRDTVLAPGGTKDAADLVKDFLGRGYTFEAFEKWLGG